MANKGILYEFSNDSQLKASKKFDIKQVKEVLHWIEEVLGRKVHPDIDSLYAEREVASVLKDGVVLCELMNVISPGSIKRINRQKTAFKQMENSEMFTKACVDYGLKELDVFQVADLFEVKAVYTGCSLKVSGRNVVVSCRLAPINIDRTQQHSSQTSLKNLLDDTKVFNCLHALGSLAQKKGFTGPSYGIRISDKKERHFTTDQIAKGKLIIPMQAGTNVVPSQAGMTPYGFSRQIVPSDSEQTVVSPSSSNVISLQYGTNTKDSQKGMTPYGLGRQITLSTSDEPVFETNSESEQTEIDAKSPPSSDRTEEEEGNNDDFGDESECNLKEKESENNVNEGNTETANKSLKNDDNMYANGDGESDEVNHKENGDDEEVNENSNCKSEVNGNVIEDCDVIEVNGS